MKLMSLGEISIRSAFHPERRVSWAALGMGSGMSEAKPEDTSSSFLLPVVMASDLIAMAST